MFSLQRLFGRDDEFCALFERSAEEACRSVSILRQIFSRQDSIPPLEMFAAARRNQKTLSTEISNLLIRSLVTAMEHSDIGLLDATLYRIPKTVEKFAERYFISADRLQDIDFLRQIQLMERATQAVLRMIKAWRAGAGIQEIKQINNTIQKIESDADDLIMELTSHFYTKDFPALKAIIAKDLFELNEKVVDRCRDAGNIITRVILKNL